MKMNYVLIQLLRQIASNIQAIACKYLRKNDRRLFADLTQPHYQNYSQWYWNCWVIKMMVHQKVKETYDGVMMSMQKSLHKTVKMGMQMIKKSLRKAGLIEKRKLIAKTLSWLYDVLGESSSWILLSKTICILFVCIEDGLMKNLDS